MRKQLMGLTLAVTLTGCGTFSDLRQGLDGLVGWDIDRAIAQLGYPTSERQVAGMRIVEWRQSRTDTIMMPTSSTTTGYATSSKGVTATYTGVTTSSTPMDFNHQCRIMLQVNDRNVIQSYQYEGDLAGCQGYIRKLARKK